MLHLNPELKLDWMQSAKILAATSLEAVQVELQATHKQLENLQMVMDMVTCRMSHLNSQFEAAQKDKLVINQMHDIAVVRAQQAWIFWNVLLWLKSFVLHGLVSLL